MIAARATACTVGKTDNFSCVAAAVGLEAAALDAVGIPFVSVGAPLTVTTSEWQRAQGTVVAAPTVAANATTVTLKTRYTLRVVAAVFGHRALPLTNRVAVVRGGAAAAIVCCIVACEALAAVATLPLVSAGALAARELCATDGRCVVVAVFQGSARSAAVRVSAVPDDTLTTISG